ncbi:hypothetical protein SDC9_119590 [bioreactor metagenome]|uniref:Uncharacterized protein n=1 Tax=bioreactor metagenome TaxID=1076179 RepID=A0A645C9H5_9ZZZZ
MCFISSVEFLDCSASFLISSATTAKPLPDSPALAASMDAFKDSKFVCSVIPDITSDIAVICTILLLTSFTNFPTSKAEVFVPLDISISSSTIVSPVLLNFSVSEDICPMFFVDSDIISSLVDNSSISVAP